MDRLPAFWEPFHSPLFTLVAIWLVPAVLASFAIGLLTDLIGAGRLLTIWPDMPAPLADAVNFFATTSMAQVMVFALIVVFLQFRPAGLFPQKGRMVEA